MSLILYKDGAYNLYSTISDGASFESALTLEQLKIVIKDEDGEAGLRALPKRLERAHKTGCSSGFNETLEECISENRAGENNTALDVDEFVARYLTLPTNS